MPSYPRRLPFVGLAFLLALLLSVSTLAVHRASALTAQAARPLSPSTAHFVHTATSSNTSLDGTFIDNSATNNQPGAILFVTSNWNRGDGSGGFDDPHPYGVYYGTYAKKWAIFNEDGATMPLNAVFNVLVVNRVAISGEVFVQTATTSNTHYNYTLIDNVFTNGNPEAQLLITQNWGNGNGYFHAINNHNVGVWYDAFYQKWAIFNEDKANMPQWAHFNVMVGADSSGGGKAFLQTTTSSNTNAVYTSVNNSLINSDPSAIVFVTHNWGSSGPYNKGVLGVIYTSSPYPPLPPNEWEVFNEDGVSMPIGATFNILAFFS